MAREEHSGRGDAVCDAVKMKHSDEETIVSSSSEADLAFDAVIGCIERILVGSRFQQLQRDFLEKYYLEFDESDENKLSYTSMFNEYVDLLEKHLEQQLMEGIPDFNMKAFTELLMQRRDEVQDDVVETLMTFTDFLTFKEMFLDYKAEKEGRGLDLSLALVVTPVPAATSRCSL